MKGRHNHTSIAPLLNILKLLLLHCVDSFSLCGAWWHTGTTSNRSLAPQGTKPWDPFPHTQWCSSSVPFRGHTVSVTQHMSPLRAVSPLLPEELCRHIPCRDAAQAQTRDINGGKLSSSWQDFLWQKRGAQKMLLFWSKHLRLSHLVRHWSLPALQWIHTPEFSRTGP